ncbi:hypothetical protein Slala02_72960 [Streptomyces lavendulae subsp. lavendulae]|nr:hypothetical protein Slala01_71180 [Streptomyces lavendulae subsp. lavendulae]GLX31477.1 hypothetical protein Slala02_72960 [Streptomyces lavendulae subsp. lavendulae]
MPTGRKCRSATGYGVGGERPAEPDRLPPPASAADSGTCRRRLAHHPVHRNPGRPGPGRPLGSKNKRTATRYDVGRVLATGESYRPAHHKTGTKPRKAGHPAS